MTTYETARETCEKTKVAAWETYRKVRNDAKETYEKAEAAAWEAYLKVEVAAQEAYDKELKAESRANQGL